MNPGPGPNLFPTPTGRGPTQPKNIRKSYPNRGLTPKIAPKLASNPANSRGGAEGNRNGNDGTEFEDQCSIPNKKKRNDTIQSSTYVKKLTEKFQSKNVKRMVEKALKNNAVKREY